MKNKYHGLASLIILGLSFVLTFGYGLYLADKIAGTISISAPASISGFKVPDDRTMAYIDFLTLHLRALAILGKGDREVDLKLFNVKPSLPSDRIMPSMDLPAMEKEGGAGFSYSLSLCFASIKNRFCVIDGKLYKEEADLPDGGKILKIENDRVFILKHNNKKWIYPVPQQGISKGKDEEAI